MQIRLYDVSTGCMECVACHYPHVALSADKPFFSGFGRKMYVAIVHGHIGNVYPSKVSFNGFSQLYERVFCLGEWGLRLYTKQQHVRAVILQLSAIVTNTFRGVHEDSVLTSLMRPMPILGSSEENMLVIGCVRVTIGVPCSEQSTSFLAIFLSIGESHYANKIDRFTHVRQLQSLCHARVNEQIFTRFVMRARILTRLNRSPASSARSIPFPYRKLLAAHSICRIHATPAKRMQMHASHIRPTLRCARLL